MIEVKSDFCLFIYTYYFLSTICVRNLILIWNLACKAQFTWGIKNW